MTKDLLNILLGTSLEYSGLIEGNRIKLFVPLWLLGYTQVSTDLKSCY